MINTLKLFNETYDTLSFDQKKKYLNEILESIIYDGNKIHINFKIKKLDNAFSVLSSLFSKYKPCQFKWTCFCMTYKQLFSPAQNRLSTPSTLRSLVLGATDRYLMEFPLLPA